MQKASKPMYVLSRVLRTSTLFVVLRLFVCFMSCIDWNLPVGGSVVAHHDILELLLEQALSWSHILSFLAIQLFPGSKHWWVCYAVGPFPRQNCDHFHFHLKIEDNPFERISCPICIISNWPFLSLRPKRNEQRPLSPLWASRLVLSQQNLRIYLHLDL